MWDVAGVGPGGRSVVLFYNSGGCGGPARATAQETASTVRITVTETVSVPGPHEACTDEYRRGMAVVRLSRYLGGRVIRGRPSETPAVPLETFVSARLRVPRFVGMSPWEAKRALERRGLKVLSRYKRVSGGRARVVGQAPAPGRTVKQKGTVRLRIGLP